VTFSERVREALTGILECDCLIEYATSGKHLPDCPAHYTDDIANAVNDVFAEFIVEVKEKLWQDVT